MARYSSLFECLDAKLPWSSTIEIRNFLSLLPIIKSVVSPVDETISELQKKVEQAKRDAENFDYLTYYKLNKNSFILNLNITKDLFSYSEPENKIIEQSKNLSNSDFQVTVLDSDMGGAIEKFLPEERKKAPGDEKGKSALALASKNLYGLFQPSRLLNALLSSVAHGNQDNAENILKKYPELLMQTGTVTDYSGRTFENISAFQYALWALDTRYMCNMMLDCLPQNEEGEKIRLSLLEQRFKHKDQGVTYILEGKTYQEKHYDFSPLTTALKEYSNNYERWYTTKNWTQMRIHWNQTVGGAQRYVPAHVAQHYCAPDKPFDPIPCFTEPAFKRTLSFYNFPNHKEDFWFPTTPAVGLGFNFSIVRGMMDKSKSIVSAGYSGTFAPLDLAALAVLCNVRTKDLALLDSRLESPIQKLEENLNTSQMSMI